eukprot:jgi/Hompol1/3671/HPOL_006715-RA
MGQTASIPDQPVSPPVPLRMCTTLVAPQGRHIVFRVVVPGVFGNGVFGNGVTEIYDLSSGNPNAVVFTSKRISSLFERKHILLSDTVGTPLVSVKHTSFLPSEWSLLQGNSSIELGRIKHPSSWTGITHNITIINQNDGVSLLVTLRLKIATILEGGIYLGDPENGGMLVAKVTSSKNMGLQSGMFAPDSVHDYCVTVAGGVDIGFVFSIIEVARESVLAARERERARHHH